METFWGMLKTEGAVFNREFFLIQEFFVNLPQGC